MAAIHRSRGTIAPLSRDGCPGGFQESHLAVYEVMVRDPGEHGQRPQPGEMCLEFAGSGPLAGMQIVQLPLGP